MTNKGKFIVIEGIDSSGKGTQFRLLKKRLKEEGREVLTLDFPRYYTSPWGKMVGEFLIGKYGKFEKVDPHLAVLPYMIDEYTWARDEGRPWLEKGGMVLLDRYFTSNVHQVAKLKTIAKKNYRDWLWKMGYDEFGILRPDLVVFVDVSPKITKKLIKQKKQRAYLEGKKKDGAERNWQHQWAAYREYKYIVANERTWKAVCCTTKGELDSPEVIHDRVWKTVLKII
jgi:dTMP kinase